MFDPDGVLVGVATVAVEFTTQLTFTIADATDFVAGDRFTITVAAGSGKYVQVDATATNGANIPAGVLVASVTAPDGVDAKGVAIVRQAIVSPTGLTWPATWNASAQLAGLVVLKTLGIIAGEGA